MFTSEVLNKAADLIEERGWAAGSSGWRVGTGPLCLEGALAAVLGLSAADPQTTEINLCPAGQALRNYLSLPVVTEPGDYYLMQFSDRRALWHWNDTSADGAAEVIEVLRAAALIEAAKENAEARVAVSA